MAHVRPILEFASVIWSPYQDIYTTDIESIQKQFVIYLLESRRNATSFRLTPYLDRCKQLRIQPLDMRREIADAVLAYDIFKENVNDTFISSKFIRFENRRALRNNIILNEPLFDTDYACQQPIARLILCVNRFITVINDSNTRYTFRVNIAKFLLSLRENVNTNV